MHLSLAAAVVALAAAQQFPHYDVRRAPSAVVIDGKVDEPAWRAAKPITRFHFNWWTAGAKEKTVARLLWDNDNLYVSFYCHDKHISATVTKRHGPVSNDDCVEIFLSPNPDKLRNYYGFEMNVIGTMLNFIRADWWKGGLHWEPEGVRLHTSYFGLPVKEESPGDDHWVLELAIPFQNFSHDAAHVPPHAGDVWRINLNRDGGKTDAQYCTWSPVNTPKPSFHVPECFGYIRFVNK